MTTHLEMSPEERDLLLDLLQQERHELPPEIRHTDTALVREALKLRLIIVDRLIDRLSRAEVVA